MTIQERIKARREELEMSQDELARKLGYSNRSAVCKIEKGEKEIRQSLIVQIAADRELIEAYHSADPITQANVCLLLGIKKEGGKSYHSAG